MARPQPEWVTDSEISGAPLGLGAPHLHTSRRQISSVIMVQYGRGRGRHPLYVLFLFSLSTSLIRFVAERCPGGHRRCFFFLILFKFSGLVSKSDGMGWRVSALDWYSSGATLLAGHGAFEGLPSGEWLGSAAVALQNLRRRAQPRAFRNGLSSRRE